MEEYPWFSVKTGSTCRGNRLVLVYKGKSPGIKTKKKKEKKEMEELLFSVSKSHQSLVMIEIQLVKYNCIVVVFNNYPW